MLCRQISWCFVTDCTYVFLVLLDLGAERLHSDLGGFQFVFGGGRNVVFLQGSLLGIL